MLLRYSVLTDALDFSTFVEALMRVKSKVPLLLDMLLLNRTTIEMRRSIFLRYVLFRL